MKAIIVDDEQQSHEVLKSLLTKHPDVKIVASAHGVNEGQKIVASQGPDLIFLDVEMNDGTGFDMLEKIGQPDFHVIFITAHNKYAQNAIRFGALDFLLKPVTAAELSGALARVRREQAKIDKIERWKLAYEAFQKFRKKELPSRMTVSTREGVYIIQVKDIIRFEADGNITQIHIQDVKKPLLASVNLGEYVKQFEAYPIFIQVHRSHMINMAYLKLYARSDGGFAMLKDNSKIPISRRFKDDFLNGLAGL